MSLTTIFQLGANANAYLYELGQDEWHRWRFDASPTCRLQFETLQRVFSKRGSARRSTCRYWVCRLLHCSDTTVGRLYIN